MKSLFVLDFQELLLQEPAEYCLLLEDNFV